MKPKMFLITALLLLLGFNFAHSQTRSKATDKGAMLVSGAFSFASQGGDLYERSHGERRTSTAIMPSLFYFIAPGVGLGLDLFYNYTQYRYYSLTAWGAGPKIGFFIDSGSKAIPFIACGVNFLSMGEGMYRKNGLRFIFGGGILIRKDHMAVSVEANYVIDRYKFEGSSGTTTGDTIAIGIGFAGFLYD